MPWGDGVDTPKRSEIAWPSQDSPAGMWNFLQVLFETAPHGIVIQDAAGATLNANAAAERLLGLTLAQLQGRASMDPRWKAVREDTSGFPAEFHPALQALRTGRPTGSVVMGVVLPGQGGTVWMEISAVPVFRPGEARPFQVFSMFVDITARKLAEQARQRREQDLAEAQAVARMGSWRVVFGEAGEDWSGSAELYRIYGYPPNQAITRETGIERMHPDDRAEVAAAWNAALEGRGPLVWTHRIVVAGVVKPVRVRVKFRFDAEGRLMEAAGIVEDLSGRRGPEEC